MKRGRSLTIAALLSLLGFALLLVLFWHYIATVIAAYIAFRYVAWKAGWRRRGRRPHRKPRLPQYVEAGAAAYAAYRVPKAIENVTVPAGGEVQMIVKGRPSRVKR